MKSIRSLSFAAVLILGGLGQFAGLAHAQSSVHGKFNLPYAVNWEHTVVPAGEYEFYLNPQAGEICLPFRRWAAGHGGSWCCFVRPNSRARVRSTN
jgi:hypothetical protein